MAHAHDRTLLASLAFGDPDKKNPRHDFACQYLALPDNHAKLLEATSAVRRPVEKAEAAETRLSGAFLELPISKGDGQYRTTIGFVDAVFRSETNWKWNGPPRAQFQYSDEDKVLLDRWARVLEHMESGPVAVLRHAVPLMISGDSIRIGLEPGSFYARKLMSVESLLAITNAAEKVLGVRPIVEIVQDAVISDDAPTIARREDAQGKLEKWTQNELLVEVKIAPVGVGDLIRQIALYREHWTARNGILTWIAATDYQISTEDRETLRSARIFHVGLGQRFDAYVKDRLEHKRIANSTEI